MKGMTKWAIALAAAAAVAASIYQRFRPIRFDPRNAKHRRASMIAGSIDRGRRPW